MKRLFAIAVIVLTAAAAVFAECPCKNKVMQHGFIDMKGPGCPRIDTILLHRQDLKLNADQAGKIKSLQQNLILQNAKTMGELRVARMDLDELLNGTNPDAEAIKNQMKKAGELEFQANSAKVDTYTKALSLLSNDQKVKYNEYWQAQENGRDQK